jgi:alkylated DNA repair dioxygenase AlkB
MQIESVPGLFYLSDLSDLSEIGGVIRSLDERGGWSGVTESENSRKFQHFGFTYNYASRKIEKLPAEEIPDFLKGLQEYLTNVCMGLGITDDTYVFNQIIVNDYQPGQGISKHTDIAAYGEVIGCFTFGSGAAMTFRKGDEKQDVYVAKDSLYIMSGDARTAWTHEMAGRKSDVVNGRKILRGRRVSVTFRMVSL